jgi:hypothetical protein
MKKTGPKTIIKTTVRIPKHLWANVRIRAISEGSTAEALVVAALTAYLKGGRP